ncbi:hypothetical protein EG68_04216 [Paragonimus skrjabini miyazakii]|uniref:EF-hand domain-containing protein n=1 Tax=Paragonimus skrjabini miyazakii TaxID=59628 RepID=A0A8S9Z2Y0_9TREM|nr:hypothetical protein EG68_04216 [Paragonimus skrjabini miyazakii]
MDPFIDIFLNIDLDNSDTITISDLETYVKRNNLDDEMIHKWTALFDPNNTGVITLEKFCDVLGLKPAQVLEKRQIIAEQSRRAQHLGDDVQVIYEDMPFADQLLITDETRERFRNVKSNEDMQKFTEQLKQFCDNKLGPLWQVAVIDGDHWITHTHLPGHAFQFHMNGHSYMFWKIPE